MNIKTPDDLKNIYSLNDEVFLKIKQLYNADEKSLCEINALLHSIRLYGVKDSYKLNERSFLKRQREFCIIYHIYPQLEFIDVKRLKK